MELSEGAGEKRIFLMVQSLSKHHPCSSVQVKEETLKWAPARLVGIYKTTATKPVMNKMYFIMSWVSLFMVLLTKFVAMFSSALNIQVISFFLKIQKCEISCYMSGISYEKQVIIGYCYWNKYMLCIHRLDCLSEKTRHSMASPWILAFLLYFADIPSFYWLNKTIICVLMNNKNNH